MLFKCNLFWIVLDLRTGARLVDWGGVDETENKTNLSQNYSKNCKLRVTLAFLDIIIFLLYSIPFLYVIKELNLAQQFTNMKRPIISMKWFQNELIILPSSVQAPAPASLDWDEPYFQFRPPTHPGKFIWAQSAISFQGRGFTKC